MDVHGALISGQDRRGHPYHFSAVDRASAEAIAPVVECGQRECEVEAALAAFAEERGTPPRARSVLLRTACELTVRDHHSVCDVTRAENGKSRTDAEREFIYAADSFRGLARGLCPAWVRTARHPRPEHASL